MESPGIIAFVVLHYGDAKVTYRCVDSILKLQGQEWVRIVVVDNDASKESTERKKQWESYEENKRVHTILIWERMGFSKANNIGYQYAKRHFDPECIIAANNDLIFEQSDFLVRMRESLQKNPCEILSPDIIGDPSGTHQSPIAQKARSDMQVRFTILLNRLCLILLPIIAPLLSWYDRRARNRKPEQEKDERREKQEGIVPCGACLIIASRFLSREEKLFEPETEFYYEEFILHSRCQAKGYRIRYDPDLPVLHGDSVATRKRASSERERLAFVMKNTLESAKIYQQYRKTLQS